MSSYIVPYRGTTLSEANANVPFSIGALRVARASYDFADDGGAVGTINLVGSTVVPSGAIVLATLLNVTTVLTSGGAATVAVGVEAAGDQQTAAAIAGAPWSTTGARWATQTFTNTPDVTTAARDIVATVAVAALTAGAFDVFVFYVLPG